MTAKEWRELAEGISDAKIPLVSHIKLIADLEAAERERDEWERRARKVAERACEKEVVLAEQHWQTPDYEDIDEILEGRDR